MNERRSACTCIQMCLLTNDNLIMQVIFKLYRGEISLHIYAYSPACLTYFVAPLVESLLMLNCKQVHSVVLDKHCMHIALSICNYYATLLLTYKMHYETFT